MNLRRLIVSALLITGCMEPSSESDPDANETLQHIVVPGAPHLILPTQGALNAPRIITMTWGWSEASPPWTYRVQVSEDSSFASLSLNVRFAGEAKRTHGMPDYATKYYWRVRAEQDDSSSQWSPIGWFTVEPPPSDPLTPGSLVILNPAYDAPNGVPLSTSFVWSSSARATSYHVQMSLEADFDPLLRDTTLDDTVLAVGSLIHLTTYYWRVRGENTEGSGEWRQGRFMAMSGYSVFNQAKSGDTWVYQYSYDDYNQSGSSQKLGTVTTILNGVAVSGEVATYNFLVRDSICASPLAPLGSTPVFTCGAPASRTQTVVLNTATNMLVSGAFSANPIFSHNDPATVSAGLGRVSHGGTNAAIVVHRYPVNSGATHYLEAIGKIRGYTCSNCFGGHGTQEKHVLQTFNGVNVPADSLAAFMH